MGLSSDTERELQRKDKVGKELEAIDRPECVLKRKGDMWAEYDVPKTWVKIIPPRIYTEERRRQMQENARANLKHRF